MSRWRRRISFKAKMRRTLRKISRRRGPMDLSDNRLISVISAGTTVIYSPENEVQNGFVDQEINRVFSEGR